MTTCSGLNRRHPQVVRSEVLLWRIYRIYSFFFLFFEEQILSLLILERGIKYQLVFFPLTSFSKRFIFKSLPFSNWKYFHYICLSESQCHWNRLQLCLTSKFVKELVTVSWAFSGLRINYLTLRGEKKIEIAISSFAIVEKHTLS